MKKYIFTTVIGILQLSFANCQNKHQFILHTGLISNHSEIFNALDETILPLRLYSDNLSNIRANPGFAYSWSIGYNYRLLKGFSIGVNFQRFNILYNHISIAYGFGLGYSKDKALLQMNQIKLPLEKQIDLNEYAALGFCIAPSLLHIDGGALYHGRQQGYAPDITFPFISERAKLNTNRPIVFGLGTTVAYVIKLPSSNTLSIYLEGTFMLSRYLYWEYNIQDTSSSAFIQPYTTFSKAQQLHALSFGLGYSFWPEKWQRKNN